RFAKPPVPTRPESGAEHRHCPREPPHRTLLRFVAGTVAGSAPECFPVPTAPRLPPSVCQLPPRRHWPQSRRDLSRVESHDPSEPALSDTNPADTPRRLDKLLCKPLFAALRQTCSNRRNRGAQGHHGGSAVRQLPFIGDDHRSSLRDARLKLA